MTGVRQPAVAGTFYPADRDRLDVLVRELLAEARGAPVEAVAGLAASSPPPALIAPHAGYAYSGPVAASAYRLIEGCGGAVSRVVLMGPAHTLYLEGVAAPSWSAFRTPLGDVRVDRAWVERALEHPDVRILDRAHRGEHGLEVHLPFLQVTLGAFAVVPLVVGLTAPGPVADLLDDLTKEPGCLVVVSSDLSHHLPGEEARALDAETARLVEGRDVAGLTPERACGVYPLRGLLEWALRRDLEVRALDLRNSGDTAGSVASVVGYGAFVVVSARGAR